MAGAPDWIEAYLDWTATQESPGIFHRWAAIATIAATLNRRVKLDRRDRNGVVWFTQYPGQISPILVAGSGKAKKSTVITIAKNMMKEAGVNVYDGKITPEQLLAKLSSMPGKQAVLCAVASELSAFLGKQSYNDGLIDILIKLADCESHPYETRKKTFDLSDSNVCFTLFGGSTPVGLSKAIPSQAQDHGFLSRYIWVYSEDGGKSESLATDENRVDPIAMQASESKKRELVIRLRGMRTLNGEFHWGKAAGDWFNTQYNDWKRTPEADEEGWAQRKWDHTARVAMVLNVARGSMNLEFSKDDLTRAHQLIQDVTDTRNKCFVHIGEHVNAENQKRILNILRGQTLVKESDLAYRMARYITDRKELQNQLGLLESAGIVGSITQGTGRFWKMLKEPY